MRGRLISTETPETAVRKPEALVVLGCRVLQGRPSGALRRRLEASIVAAQRWPDSLILLSGGKLWDGETEASVMQQWLEQAGLSPNRLVLEEQSQTTKQNAHICSLLLRERQIESIALVTSDFHMKRALYLFAARGFAAVPVPAQSQLSGLKLVRTHLREWGARRLDRWGPEQ